jgi:hypothetical protein
MRRVAQAVVAWKWRLCGVRQDVAEDVVVDGGWRPVVTGRRRIAVRIVRTWVVVL